VSTPILDAGGLTRLAERSIMARERLRRLRGAGWWPPVVPAVVLTEALRGDPRQDFYEERLLAMTDVEPVDEATARRAARLRTQARRGSAVDAVVVAVAEAVDGMVLTQDPGDLKALAAHTDPTVRVERV
jgi:predicted nucleic acid-binding protein